MAPLAGVRRALFVHAHPDDESLATGGLIALLASRGVTVSLITCTRGERGEVVPGPLKALEGTPELGPHRERELAAACAVLGVARWRFLGGAGRYEDSGMRWAPNGEAIAPADPRPGAFILAPEAEALAELIAAVDEEGPELIVSYDELGGYGHPDHRRAALLARRAAAARGIRCLAVPAIENERPGDVRVDIAAVLPVKRAALAAHASQLTLTDAGVRLSGEQELPLLGYELLRPAQGC